MPRQIEVFRYAADTQEWPISDAIIDGIPGYSDDPALQLDAARKPGEFFVSIADRARSIQLTAS